MCCFAILNYLLTCLQHAAVYVCLTTITGISVIIIIVLTNVRSDLLQHQGSKNALLRLPGDITSIIDVISFVIGHQAPDFYNCAL